MLHLPSTCTHNERTKASHPRATNNKKPCQRYPELPFRFNRFGSAKRDAIFYLQRTLQTPPSLSSLSSSDINNNNDRVSLYFLRNEQPSVNRAFPPVGWQRTVEQPPQMTTVWACEKTVVMVKQPGHLTSMKKERGAGTSV